MPNPKSQWTILVYIAAHNNLDLLGKRSLNQILSVGSTSEIRLAALYDHPNGATRFIVGQSGNTGIEESLGSFDSGDPDALLTTIQWAFEQCPAEHYGLVLWSHGSGWRPEDLLRIARQVRGDAKISDKEAKDRSNGMQGTTLFRTTLAHILRHSTTAERAICFDDGSCHSLDTLELDRVLRNINTLIGQPLDLLGLDACVMATVEIAYQLRQSVHYLVASEELVPGYSWPYDTILSEIKITPGISACDFAKLIVRHYSDYYTVNPPTVGDVTKIALDISQISELVHSLDDLASALLANMSTQAGLLWEAQRITREKETLSSHGIRRVSKFNFHLWDLGTLSAYLATHSDQITVQVAAKALRAALASEHLVLAEAHLGEWFDTIGGITVYAVPPGVQRISPYYSELALTRDTCWGKMLEAYHQTLA